MFVAGKDARMASSYSLRNSAYVQTVAKFYAERNGSAEEKIGRALAVIDIWANGGGTLRNPRGCVLDILGERNRLDGYVHAMYGSPVFKELPHFRLEDPVMAFKEDGRRTMNRFLGKATKPGKRLLDQRLLSMLIWLALAMTIALEIQESKPLE